MEEGTSSSFTVQGFETLVNIKLYSVTSQKAIISIATTVRTYVFYPEEGLHFLPKRLSACARLHDVGSQLKVVL
jgi:hypothetical protein